MRRRDFLKLASAAGLAVSSPWWLAGRARAAEAEPYSGPFFVCVHAAGGWDPTSVCDPKGRANEEAEAPVNMYFTDDIGTAGKLSYAPVANHAAFFDKWHQQLLVINGVDTATNGHDSGTRNTWSGKLTEGYPAFAALAAGALDPTRPLAFVSNGGYDHTSGLVAPTRVGSLNALTRLAWPNRIESDKPETRYHSEAAAARIAAARTSRLDRLIERDHLPRRAHSLSMLHAARTGGNELQLLTEVLPETLDSSNNPLKRQAQLAIAAYKAGLAVSTNLTLGGFDTHGNHDDSHYPRLGMLLDGVDFLMEEAAKQQVADKVVVVVGSDFGRTPWYNDGNGKDHWSITSMMLMGAGISGNRVVGTTDAGHKPIPVDPITLEPDPSGIRVTPEHVQQALRELAGVAGSEAAKQFPLTVTPMPKLLTG